MWLYINLLQKEIFIKQVQIVNGKYLKTIQCNVQMQIIKTTDYGFRIDLIDDRCNENTLWKPPINGIIPCRWIKRK